MRYESITTTRVMDLKVRNSFAMGISFKRIVSGQGIISSRKLFSGRNLGRDGKKNAAAKREANSWKQQKKRKPPK